MPKAFVLNNSFVANEGVFQIIEKSFNSDNNLVIKGIATTNRIDKEGESLTITPQALKNGWQVFLSKGAPMLVEHGRTSHFESDKVGYYVSIDIPEDYNPLESDIPNKVQITVIGVVTDPEAIRLCLSGYLNSFSVDLSLPSPNSVWEKDKGTFKLITSVIINEITICNEPINPDCNFTIVTDQKLIEQYGFSNHIGDKVQAFDANAVVKSLYIDESQNKYYELEFENKILKSVSYIPEKSITGATAQTGQGLVGTNFDESLDKGQEVNFNEDLVYEGLKSGIQKEGVVPENQLIYFRYNTEFDLTFGDTKKYKTRVKIGDNKIMEFIEPIKEINKKAEETFKDVDWAIKKVASLDKSIILKLKSMVKQKQKSTSKISTHSKLKNYFYAR